jgi:hypothetical protein
VRVRATRELAEAWRQEVRRQVSRSGHAEGEARVREPLEDTVGGPTLTALASVLASLEGWVEDEDGVFRHDLDGGTIAFDPATRELEIVARIAAEISVTGVAAATVTAEITGTVEAEGIGTYYDDGWGGITEADARQAAERALGPSMEQALEDRREAARLAADADAGIEVERQATARAEAAYTAAAESRAAELREQARDHLTAVGVQGRALFHQALARAYRDAILAYARARRADNIHCTEQDGVLDIEFDLRI